MVTSDACEEEIPVVVDVAVVADVADVADVMETSDCASSARRASSAIGERALPCGILRILRWRKRLETPASVRVARLADAPQRMEGERLGFTGELRWLLAGVTLRCGIRRGGV